MNDREQQNHIKFDTLNEWNFIGIINKAPTLFSMKKELSNGEKDHIFRANIIIFSYGGLDNVRCSLKIFNDPEASEAYEKYHYGDVLKVTAIPDVNYYVRKDGNIQTELIAFPKDIQFIENRVDILLKNKKVTLQ